MSETSALRARMQAAMDQATTVSVSSDPPPWADYLADHAAATLFHRPEWGTVMKQAYGNRPFYLTARRGDAVVGILQVVLQRSLLFGTHLCSLPYMDAAGILADDASAAEALVGEARGLMRETGAKWVELRHTDPVGEGLPSRTDKATLRLALPANPETLWNAFTPKVRNQVRKGEREGLAVESGGAALIGEFHGVYARTMRDLGSPPHGRRFFRLVAEHFGEAVRLFVARLEGRAIAASFTLTDAGATRVPWAAADWRFRGTNANMLLYWHMLKEACERGAPAFDFGRSTRDAGTYRFKKQWGAAEVPLVWQYLLPEGAEVPEVRPDSPKYRAMVAVWRRLPVPLVRLIGPRLIAKVS